MTRILLVIALLAPASALADGCGSGPLSALGDAASAADAQIEADEAEFLRRVNARNVQGAEREKTIKLLLREEAPAIANAWNWANDAEEMRNLPLMKIDWRQMEEDLGNVQTVLTIGQAGKAGLKKGWKEAQDEMLKTAAEEAVNRGRDALADKLGDQVTSENGRTAVDWAKGGAIMIDTGTDIAEGLKNPLVLLLVVPKMSAGNIADGVERGKKKIAAENAQRAQRFNKIVASLPKDVFRKKGASEFQSKIPHAWGPEEWGTLTLMYYKWKAEMRKANPASKAKPAACGNNETRTHESRPIAPPTSTRTSGSTDVGQRR